MIVRLRIIFMLIILMVIVHVHAQRQHTGTPRKHLNGAIAGKRLTHGAPAKRKGYNPFVRFEDPHNTSGKANWTKEAKIMYGCDPPEDWILMYPTLSIRPIYQFKAQPVKNVCLEKGYSHTIAPKTSPKVLVALNETKVKAVDEIQKTVTIDLQFSAQWQDPRIKSTFMENETTLKLPSIVGERKSMLWTPKFFVENSIGRDEKAMKTMMLEKKNFESYNNSMLWSDGDILLNMDTKSSVAVNCAFDFSDYPLDTHACLVRISFFDVGFEMSNRTEIDDFSKLYTAGGFYVLQSLKTQSLEYSEEYGFSTSGILLEVKMARVMGPLFCMQYIPTIAIVIAAGFSFAIPYSALAGRIGLVMTLFLSLSLFFTDQMNNTPAGRDFNALGVYQLTSLLFVLATLFETVAVILVRLHFEWCTFGIYDAPNGLRMILKLMNKEKMSLNGRCKITPHQDSLDGIKRRQAVLEQEQDRLDNVMPEAWKKMRTMQMEKKQVPFIVKMDFFAFCLFNISFSVFNYYYWNLLYKY